MKNTIFILASILLVSSQVTGFTQYNDGGTHNITTTVNDDIWVDWETPGMETTVNVGATISSPYELQGFNDSRLNMLSGGWVRMLTAQDNTEVKMSGGFIRYGHIYGNSQMTLSNGSVQSLNAYNESNLIIKGGSVDYILTASDNAEVIMSGGSIGSDLNASYNSNITISGGLIGRRLFVSGNSIASWSGGTIAQELRLSIDAILTIDGSDFTIDGSPVGFGTITSILGGEYIDEPFRHLAGILDNGNSFNTPFRIGNNAQIVLIPEPVSAAIFGLGAVIISLQRKRR